MRSDGISKFTMIIIFDKKGFSAVAELEAHTLVGADLSGRNLANGNFVEMDLRGAMFHAATLQDADFRLAKLDGANFHAANLNGADFRNTSLIGAIFDGAQLQGARFAGARVTLDAVAVLGANGVDITELSLESA